MTWWLVSTCSGPITKPVPVDARALGFGRGRGVVGPGGVPGPAATSRGSGGGLPSGVARAGARCAAGGGAAPGASARATERSAQMSALRRTTSCPPSSTMRRSNRHPALSEGRSAKNAPGASGPRFSKLPPQSGRPLRTACSAVAGVEVRLTTRKGSLCANAGVAARPGSSNARIRKGAIGSIMSVAHAGESIARVRPARAAAVFGPRHALRVPSPAGCFRAAAGSRARRVPGWHRAPGRPSGLRRHRRPRAGSRCHPAARGGH